MKGNWLKTLSPDQKAAHLAKMRAGRRARKAAHVAVEIPAQTAVKPNEPGSLEALGTIDWASKTEHQLRYAINVIDEAKEKAAVRLRILMDKRTGELCGNPKCNRPFANRRHFGELSWHDHESNSIRVLRACSPACYAIIQQIAEGVKRSAMEREHSRLSHA